MEHVERPFKSVQQFTQEDVNNNRIIYRPPEKEIGNREKEFIFYFTGQLNSDIHGLKFSGLILNSGFETTNISVADNTMRLFVIMCFNG